MFCKVVGLLYVFIILNFIIIKPVFALEKPVHLFILSGQSNMVNLRLRESFLPLLRNEFGEDHVVVVRDASNGKPIRRWMRDWKPSPNDIIDRNIYLYDRLIDKVKMTIAGKNIVTVTFIWMQGEREGRSGPSAGYASSLKRLINQLIVDLKIDDINLVVGRISDHLLSKPHWVEIRRAQIEVAETRGFSSWVNTDDLNDGIARDGKKVMIFTTRRKGINCWVKDLLKKLLN